MVSVELRTFADTHLNHLTSQFPLGFRPRLEWRRFRVTAGMAYYQEGAIGLSIVVLNNREQIAETLGHEYAHLLAFYRAGRHGIGHGPAWKKAMCDIGLEPKVRHNFSVERNARRQQVDYLCLRCGVTIIRKRRLPGRKKYVHAQCGGDLKLLRVSQVT